LDDREITKDEIDGLYWVFQEASTQFHAKHNPILKLQVLDIRLTLYTGVYRENIYSGNIECYYRHE
jgi:hypothetical protein